MPELPRQDATISANDEAMLAWLLTDIRERGGRGRGLGKTQLRMKPYLADHDFREALQSLVDAELVRIDVPEGFGGAFVYACPTSAAWRRA